MIAIYARVSTEEQAKHGFSLADQLRECRSKALAEGLAEDILEYVDEGESGEFLDRRQLTRLRKDLQRGILSYVICLDPDRLSRKLMNQLIVTDEIESRAKLLFVNGDYAKTPEGQLFYQMRGAISQFEKAKINERMTRGRREKARQGKILRDYHIYGYDFCADTGQLTINDREASVVKLVFDLFLHPRGNVRGLNGIAEYLNQRGIPSKHGKKFHRQVIRQMLMNRTYIGEFYQNKWNTEGVLGNKYRQPEERITQRLRPEEEWIFIAVPPIIDRKVFELAGRLLEQSRRRFAGKSKHQYLLSGLLRCHNCGNTLTGRKQKNWGKTVTLYTDRKTGANVKNPGCGTSIRCTELDNAVWNAVLEWVAAPTKEVAGTLFAGSEYSDVQREHDLVVKELHRIGYGIQRMLELLLDEELDQAVLVGQLKQLQQRQHELLEEQKKLEAQLEPMLRSPDSQLQSAWQILTQVPGEELPIEWKKALIRSVVREIHIRDLGKTVQVQLF